MNSKKKNQSRIVHAQKSLEKILADISPYLPPKKGIVRTDDINWDAKTKSTKRTLNIEIPKLTPKNS